MVTIESITAEILLIWKNVARTNVAWTNVHLTIDLDFPRMGNSLPKRFYDRSRGEHITLFPNNPFGKSFSFYGVPGRVSLFICPRAILSRIAILPIIYMGKVYL